MGTVEYQTGHSFERRIGRRVAVAPIDVQWSVALPRSRYDDQLRVEHPGRILELSVTGAAISGPTDLPVEVGGTALVRSPGGDSAVVVRHIARGPGGQAHYGVELDSPDPALVRLVGEVVADGGGANRSGGAPSASSVGAEVLDLTGTAPVVELSATADPAPARVSTGRSVLDEVFGLMEG